MVTRSRGGQSFNGACIARSGQLIKALKVQKNVIVEVAWTTIMKLHLKVIELRFDNTKKEKYLTFWKNIWLGAKASSRRLLRRRMLC